MNLLLKSNPLRRFVILLAGGLIGGILLVWWMMGTIWTRLDFQLLDVFYKQAMARGQAPASSSAIVYLGITDDTYRYWGGKSVEHSALAEVTTHLAPLNPNAIIYDMIFARPGDPAGEQAFAESIQASGRVYLPIAFELADEPLPLRKEAGSGYTRLLHEYLHQPEETGEGWPLYGIKSLLQLDAFSKAAYNSGHINAPADPDGVHRHQALLLKVNDSYFPTLSLAVFLDYLGVSFADVSIHWGHELRIPAAGTRRLEHDLSIPIDRRGRTYIPYSQVWSQNFTDHIFVHNFLDYAKNPDVQGNLLDFFEGKFVFIGDFSQGAPDLGHTPLEENVPLIMVHTALLNGFLTQQLYDPWTFQEAALLLLGMAILLTLAALPKASWILYLSGGAMACGVLGLAWQQFITFRLFPLAGVGISFLLLFVGLIAGLEVVMARQQAFIHEAFAKYVPEKVVEELIAHPEKLSLGGEERVVSILFADIQDFTSMCEHLPPSSLVRFLNEFFTEMSEVIIAEGGIIDKYIGDGIMAEFGAPLSLPNHADAAVSAALKMQRRMSELRPEWARKGYTALSIRIGIHTGPVIIGNMGSRRVFDYTVLGDAANLASRLEGANKYYSTSVLISEFTRQALPRNRFRLRELDVIKVKGRSKAVKVFEVYGWTEEPIAARDDTYYQHYHSAFQAYLNREFELARREFSAALALRDNDPACTWMLLRIKMLEQEGAPAEWDGSVTLDAK